LGFFWLFIHLNTATYLDMTC